MENKMTRDEDSMKLERKVVVVFDICSSSKILEDLLRTENQKKWRNLLIKVKKFIVKQKDSLNFEIYKFLGDGWILLFDENINGGRLIEFLQKLSTFYTDEYAAKIKDTLETSPEIVGITIGIDRGTLIKIVMNSLTEYIGRPLNIAARLQGAIKDKDESPQNKLLISGHYYATIKKQFPKGIEGVITSRILRNISEEAKIKCYKVQLFPEIESSNSKKISKAGALLERLKK